MKTMEVYDFNDAKAAGFDVGHCYGTANNAEDAIACFKRHQSAETLKSNYTYSAEIWNGVWAIKIG